MAKGNWRSGKGHGPAEVGSHRKVVDGYVMKKSAAFPTEKEANQHAENLRVGWGFRTVIIRSERAKINKWVVYRTISKSQSPYEPDLRYDTRTGEMLK
jgi:hypothetical protein